MWFSYSPANNSCQHHGLHERRDGQRSVFYANAAQPLAAIQDLRIAEYQQAIEVDFIQRRVSFGRDYLGHFPLFYVDTAQGLCISDDVARIRCWLAEQHQAETLSAQSVALYLAMGYVPQGRTIFNEINSCRNTTIYHWQNGQVTSEDVFKPVEVATDCTIADVDSALNREISRVFDAHANIDVWCSGGLDSSIIAMLCNVNGRQADLLTLRHANDFRGQFGDGELPYALELQKHLNATLRTVDFSFSEFKNTYYDFLSLHPSPVIDPVVTPKYMLARKTRYIALTGEGGDPIFAGVKNNTVSFMHSRHPTLSFGTIYALAHLRLYPQIAELMVAGRELQSGVSDYLQGLWDRYPGEITRKLFYMNTFEKQGGMIFPKNYFAGKYGDVAIRHPLASRQVYETAFALNDDLKYQYPNGKLALCSLYADRLPDSIVNRKKSGTLVPLTDFIKNIHVGRLGFDALLESGLFNEAPLQRILDSSAAQRDNSSVFVLYALLSLNNWLELNTNGGSENAKCNISTGTSNL